MNAGDRDSTIAASSVAGAMAEPSPGHLPDVPPWVWVWMAMFAVGLLGTAGPASSVITGFLGGALSPTATATGPLPWWHIGAVAVPTLLVLIPYAGLGLGVAMTAFPGLRGRWVEWRHRLSPPPVNPGQAVAEILAFVECVVPGAAVRVYLADATQVAVVYPTGYRRTAIGIFGGLPKLWRRDRAVAEAVLLHETAHVLHRDALALGAGSSLKAVAERWVWIALWSMVVPVMVAAGAVWFQNLHGFMQQADTSAGAAFRGVAVGLLGTFGLAAFALAFIVPSMLLTTASVFAPPIAAIWAAELSADRSAAAWHPAGAKALLRLLGEEQRRGAERGFWRRLGSGFSHPPPRLRRWLLRRSARRSALAITLLVFPLGLAASLVFHAASAALLAVTSHLVIPNAGSAVAPPAGFAASAFGGLEGMLKGMARLHLLAAGVAFLAWPLVARRSAAGRDPVLYIALGAPLAALGLWSWLRP